MRNTAVLLDANVILDYITSREPDYRVAYKIIEMCCTGQVNGYLALHSVSIIWYVLRKYIPDEKERRQWIRKILQIVQVTGASHESVLRAVDMEEFRDFEDCLQDRCAEEIRAQYIITNNVKDFQGAVVKAVTPDEFCKMYER